MPEVFAGEYRTREGRLGVTVSRDSTDLHRSERTTLEGSRLDGSEQFVTG